MFWAGKMQASAKRYRKSELVLTLDHSLNFRHTRVTQCCCVQTHAFLVVFPFLIAAHAVTFENLHRGTSIGLGYIQTIFFLENQLAPWSQNQHLRTKKWRNRMNNNGGVESCTRRSECFLVIKVLEWNFMNPEGWLLLEEMSWVKVVRGKGVEKGGERRGGGGGIPCSTTCNQFSWSSLKPGSF